MKAERGCHGGSMIRAYENSKNDIKPIKHAVRLKVQCLRIYIYIYISIAVFYGVNIVLASDA
jgi:hypothetical protein